jgi:hypothetical protein
MDPFESGFEPATADLIDKDFTPKKTRQIYMQLERRETLNDT